MSKFDYDLIILGGGAGGFAASGIAKGLGKKTAIVEKDKLGGDCTWYGCVPSKALIKSAEVAHLIQNSKKYGIESNEQNQFCYKNVMTHVRSIIQKIYAGETPEVMAQKGIDVFIGEPKFLNPHEIQVNGKSVSAGKFIITTGSHAFVPSIEGIENITYLTNENLFELEELPQSMIVLGGGPIGTEMAAALNRLGVNITLIEKSDRILSRDEPELVNLLMDLLKKEGVRLLTNREAIKFEKKDEQIQVTVKNENNQQSDMTADAVLIAIGRRPNIEGLDLENAGIDYSPKGIKVNDKLQTSAQNIYAIGDVIGSYQFSHIAEYHATIAIPNALLPIPIKKKVNYDNVVWATFTNPELAHAGITENEARDKYGDKIRIYKFNYDHADRPRTDVADVGMSKFITDRKGKLLGIHILGNQAADLLHEAQLAKSLGVKFSKISGMVHIYPTYGDIIKRPADRSYVDNLQNNFFVKLAKKIAGKS